MVKTKTKTKKTLLLLLSLFFAFIGLAQEYNSFDVRYQNNIKGDLTFIGNDILNRDDGPGRRPTDAYNNLSTNNNNNPETGGRRNYNDFKNMQYINIDPDGTNNFSSSTATLTFPNPDCNIIRYAGLYWSATYPSATANGFHNGTNLYILNTVPLGQGRQNDFNQVRFRVPGGNFVNITADEILYDGFTDPALQSNSPYACYADVTALVTALANPTGDYTTANIRATTGAMAGQGGSSGGWTLVIVYENPTLTGKLITTFDGFARVRNTDTIGINYNGFTTIPVGPVRASLGAGTLEGDFRIPGDGMSIRTPTNPISTQLSNGVNPANNFFNSNITLNGAVMAARNPSSINTLGYDSDMFPLNNPANSVISNNETSATFEFTTNGDQYYPFFNSFNIEIIEPQIVLEKRVEDIAGNDITGQGVNLGQILDYVLTFQNIGNDDVDNYIIRDILPINVTLDEPNFVLPTGVTYSYDATSRTVTFSVPNSIVEEGDTERSIRMRVQVAENCLDFIDACTDLIQNLAFSTYQGIINDNQITDDPSVTEFNNCQPPTPGATNFLLDDLDDCNFRRTVQLCGDSIILEAGDNFDNYIWVSDDNNNGLFDATDTVLNDGDPDGNPNTLIVTTTGTYIVDKIVADPCKGFKEIFDVELFGSTQSNPIVDWFNDTNNDADPTNDVQGQIVQCSIDGDFLPQIFLCGNNDSQIIEINISDAQSIEWELLDESSCTAAPNDCANKNLTCSWNQVGTGSDFTANSAGKYRLIINYQNGCFSRFYFDIYQNNLDIEYIKNDIICTTEGNITITNLGASYGYQLVDITNNSILVPFSANNGPSFDFGTGENGSYRIDVVQLDGSGNPIPGACIFSTPEIGILERDFQVEVQTTPANCNNQGTIKIDILNVEPNYTYVLKLADGTLVDDETAQSDNTHTFSVNAGDYIVEASTEDGCFESINVTVDRTPDPTLSAVTTSNIGCVAGTIDLTVTGGLGNPDFNYAIWSKDGTQLYSTVGNIPGGAYQVENTFTFGWRDTDGDGTDEYFPGEDGDYVFVVVDANNCFAFSNEVTIEDLGALTIDSISETQPSCSGTNDGALTINISGGVGPFQYSIDNGATYQGTPNFVNLIAGSYTIRVLDSSGCDVTDTHDLNEPFPLSASVGVSRDASCDPNGAEVRITNVTGGTLPYTYSFDGGTTFGTATTAILPAGTYTVIVRDPSCDFPMTVTVEDKPAPPLVTLTPEVNYNCDGGGIITATPDITTYDYTYELDGVLNTPPTSNVWNNVAPGTYTVRTNYVSQTPPTPSLLLNEDFGYGATIPNPNTSGYYYENQADDVSPSGAPIDTNKSINDYEYAVTDSIAKPFGAWLNPVDHTSGTRATDGRYLVINIGAPAPGQIIYQKPINDIIANQPLSISIWLINLIRGGNRVAPDLTIELRHPTTGAVVATANTGSVPENRIWNEYVLSLDPGINPSLNLVITTNESEVSGNDVAIDDITVFQTPEVCSQFVELPVVVEAGRTFEASTTSFTTVSCNGLNDATITFEVDNFDATAGFEYSIDGGSFIGATTSPVTTTTTLGAGSHTITIRKADETTCSLTLNQTITEPALLVANASITTPLTCTNGGATITASASGGTPTYTYQLEDITGTAISSYDFATNGANIVFSGLSAGDYIVRVRDANNCEDPIDVALTIAPANPVEFTVTPTTCYSGGTDATIQVDVTNGNGNYTFSINGDPWVTPTPTNSTTHTFTGLTSGSYTINVQDGSGCTGVLQNIEIDPQLTVSASAPKITACATSTDITISASGGDGNYVYAVVATATTPASGDFSATNPVTVNAAGNYDVHVRDNNGNTEFCSAVYTITIVKDPPIAITPTPTDVTCFGGSDGAISIVVDSGGSPPFTYSIDNGVTYHVGTNFPNLTAGTYPVRVRDSNGCESTPIDVDVNEPNQITAEAEVTQNYTCLQTGSISVGSVTPTAGGSGNYQYSINGGAWTTSTTGGHVFTGLTNGTFSIRVRDANAISCEITIPDIIIDALPTAPTLSTSIDYNCDGTGNITVLPDDPTYSYRLNTGSFQSSNTFSDVTIGTHTITVDYGRDCTIDTTVIVEDGHAFESSITTFENLDCNADNSGSITITADNFGAGGYEYSLDATTFVGPFTGSEQITGLSAQTYTITVRDVDNPIAGCTVTLNQTLTEPTPIIASASITEEFTCNNTGATITASASGGTPTYAYQLEDGLGSVITTYQTGSTFTNLSAGDYIVRVRDTNLCEDPIDAVITVIAPVNPTFTVSPTVCYSGNNDAEIQVDITSVPGNGGFQFSINGGPWVTPSPITAVTYTFGNLANGTYTIDVRDAYGCAGVQESITINPILTAILDVVDVTTCADGSITVSASGGDGSYQYAFVPTTTSPTGFFGASNTLTVTAGNEGTFDVYVRDNSATTPFCEYIETVTVNPATPLTITTTPTDPLCHDGVGSIEVNVTSGDNPYSIQIIDLDNGGASNQTDTNILNPITNYYNLTPGNYTIIVTDSNNCNVTNTPITINNPDELTADIVPILPSACGSVDPNDYGFQFISYPTTYPTGTTIEFSADGGVTWTGDDSNPGTSDRLMGYISGTNVYPTMRTVVGGVEVCRTDLPRYTIPYPLDDLDISISTVVVACNELQVTVQGTAGVPNYEYAYTDDPANFVIGAASWTAPTPGAYTWTGLIPGRTYVFYVRDSTGCIRQSNVNVNDITINPLEITPTYEPSCSGANDAEITYTIVDTDGTSHPSMRWEFYNAATGAVVQTSGGNIAWNNTITVSSLPQAEYYIVVTEVDAGGVDACVSASENLIVEELDPITATLNKLSDIKCNAPGLISVENINGGGGTFTFTVTGPVPFTTITSTSDNPISIPANSPAGNYNVTITDQFGCFADLGPIALTLSPNPTIDSMVLDNCALPTSLTINASSTAAQILYSIDGGTNYLDNGGVFNNLAPATYNVAIIDSNGCTDTDTIEIYAVLEANVTLSKLLDCTVSPDAEITIEVTFGSGSYDYEITNGLGGVVARTTLPSNPFVFQTTVPEEYTITVYDNNTSSPECNREFSIEVPPAVLPVLAIDSFTNVTCNGADDGSITVSVTDNGIGPYTFEVISGPGSTATFPIAATTSTSISATFTALAGLATPGITYTIRATGANGCFTDSTQAIVQPDAIANVNASVQEFACSTANNQNDATITINDIAITGGSGTYIRYEFVNDQGTPATGDDVVVQNGSSTVYTETNTDGGNYTINVYDDNGCVGSTTAIIAEFIEIIDPSITITQDITCNPGNDAEVTIGVTLNPASGTPTLNYSVAGTDNAYSSLNQPSPVFAGLGIGNYIATVTNADTGCFVQTTFEIEDPNNFEISTTTIDVVCFGDDGSVSFTINDPVNPYAAGFTWQVYNSQGTVALGDDVIIAAANGTSANVGPTTPFALPAGEYRVEVTQDSDPSCVNNQLFTIAGPSAAITASTELTPITCAGNDGIIEIIDVLGGWGNYQYYVGTIAPTVVGDYSASPRFENLAPGTYEAWVIDQNGCQQQVQNGIILADPLPITGTLQVNQPNCTNFSGEIEVIGVSGGQGNNYTFQLVKDSSPVGVPQNTTVFSGLDAGSYQVQITDQWTCTFTTTAVFLYEPIVPKATVVKTIDCTASPGGEITITQTGGSGSFNYDVTYPDMTAGPSNITGIFTGLTQVGVYTFTITDQATGHACSTTITQELQPAIIPVINIDAFTNVTCNDANDGTISVSVVDNGIGPYSFEIISGPGSIGTFPLAPAASTTTSATFTALEGLVGPGITYTIRATGSNNCTIDITQVIVQPEIIDDVNATVVEFACASGNNSDNASITIDETTINGGSGNYVRYEFINTTTSTTVQDSANPVFIETDFSGGNYTINVYDDMGCLGSTTALIEPFVQISDPTITTNVLVSCNDNDSEIQVNVTITPATGTPNLEYTTTGTDNAYSATNTTGLFTALGIGNYIIRVTNLDTSCYVETTHSITDPNIMDVVITKLSDEECLNNGVDDGSFSVAITDYTGDYSYQVYDLDDNPVAGFSGTGNTSIPLIISNLIGGGYYVRITQATAPFCEQNSNAITILAPDAPISATVNQETGVGCANNEGSLLVDPVGGEGPYTIVLTNTTTSQSYTETNVEAFIFTDLAAGDYTIEVSDAFSCLYSDTITLVRPDPIVADISATTLACYNDTNASVTATLVGSRNVSPVYLYQLNTYDDLAGTNPPQISVAQAGDTFTNLPAGFYSITISDDVGCSTETEIVEIVNPEIVAAQLIRTSPLTCTTGVEFELSATGGSGTYEYSEDNITFFPMVGNSITLPQAGILAAGTYSYYVRDAINICEAIRSNEISEDPIEPLVLTLDTAGANINCFGETTASIYADADGGLGNYLYELYSDSVSPANLIIGPQALGEFTGLAAGTYWVNVTSEDCVTAPQQVVITEPSALEFTPEVTNITCNGEEDGSIIITLTGGSGGYQYSISPNLDQFDDENVFDELLPGDYTVIAQDQNGCFVEYQFTITEPEVLETIGSTTAEVCIGEENGSATVTISGGTAPYSTSFGDNTNYVQDQVDFSNLAAGNYIVYVRDAAGCEDDIIVTVDVGVNLSANVEPIYECSGDTPDNYVNITLDDESVIGDVMYALDSMDIADMQLNPDFRNITPGPHYIAVSHINGCIITIDFEIEAFEPLMLVLEQNGINEITAIASGGVEEYRFVFDGIDNETKNTFYINRSDTFVVTVIDKNGCEVSANIQIEFIDIELPNFFTPDGDGKNDRWQPKNIEQYPEILIKIYDRYGRVVEDNVIDRNGWDGKYNQADLPTGDYWYVIKLNGDRDDREFVGHFTLYR